MPLKNPANIKIDSLSYPVYLGTDPWPEIHQIILPYLDSGGVFILTDANTSRYCLPLLLDNIPLLAGRPLFSIEPGEQSKDLPVVADAWTWLMESGAGRNSLLINLGGGVVSDLGGFAAATFNRGMKYINIPTSLIGQVDASIGGKSALNINGIKNQVGLFYNPAAVFIIHGFLETLPEDHFKSGIAEIIKCAALSGGEFWQLLKQKGAPDRADIFPLIYEAVTYKCRIIAEDPLDNYSRQMLNFGHTIGHAIESLYNSMGDVKMLHGQAIAAGMISEAWLSNKLAGMSLEDLKDLSTVLKSHFELNPIEEKDYTRLLQAVIYDKKKSGKGIRFALLQGLGKHSPGIVVNNTDMIESFGYYNEVVQR